MYLNKFIVDIIMKSSIEFDEIVILYNGYIKTVIVKFDYSTGVFDYDEYYEYLFSYLVDKVVFDYHLNRVVINVKK